MWESMSSCLYVCFIFTMRLDRMFAMAVSGSLNFLANFVVDSLFATPTMSSQIWEEMMPQLCC